MVARVCGDLAPPVLGMEAIGLDLAVAGQDGAHQGHDAGVGVIERQRIVDALLASAQRRQAAERGVPGAARRPRSRARGCSPWAGRSCPRCRGCWRGSRARGGSPAPAATRSRSAGGEALRHHDRRLVRALRQGLPHLRLAGGERQHEIGLAVLEEVGGLAGPVVGIDRHAAHADRVAAPACAGRARGGSRAASRRGGPGRSPHLR